MDYQVLDHEATLEDIKSYQYDNQKIGVLLHMEDKDGNILLQQRGVKSRDENGLYEDIGGKYEEDDMSFKDTIIRELEEEAGSDVKIELSNSIGIFHCHKNPVNWIFIIYFGTYIEGDFHIMEPDKCEGYKSFSYEEAISSDKVTESCKFLIKSIKENK